MAQILLTLPKAALLPDRAWLIHTLRPYKDSYFNVFGPKGLLNLRFWAIHFEPEGQGQFESFKGLRFIIRLA